ncbi:MAG TPA: type IV pilin protein [Rudaea sp.]|jgi:type IV pilus assembly protein PilE
MKKARGFTLIELMVVVIIIAILAAIAIPSYLSQTRKARRNAAEDALQQIALLEERYRGDNTAYLDSSTTTNWGKLGGNPSGMYYLYGITVSAAVAATAPCTGTIPPLYTATATAQGTQTKDKASGLTCTPLTYAATWDATNCVLATTKGPNSTCWAQ